MNHGSTLCTLGFRVPLVIPDYAGGHSLDDFAHWFQIEGCSRLLFMGLKMGVSQN